MSLRKVQNAKNYNNIDTMARKNDKKNSDVLKLPHILNVYVVTVWSRFGQA